MTGHMADGTESAASARPRVHAEGARNLVPTGELGVRGKELPPEERARIFDELFFEGDRRAPYLWRFFALMVFSSTIAALGLLNDSAAVVIGAMLVAPLMAPILGLSAALVQSWTLRQVESLAIIAGGALVGVAIGWLAVNLFPEIDQDVTLPGEVLARTAPNLLDLGIAVAAGAAGAYVMIRKEAGSALPGVGIAVALVPPLGTIGITLGADRGDLAEGALLLFLTNIVCITLAASLVFLAAGFVPRMQRILHRTSRRWSSIATIAAVVLVAVPLAWHTRNQLDEASTQRTETRVVETWAPTATVDSVSVDTTVSPTFLDIAVSGPKAPGDPDELAALISTRIDESVEVQLRYTRQIAGTGTGTPGAASRSPSAPVTRPDG